MSEFKRCQDCKYYVQTTMEEICIRPGTIAWLVSDDYVRRNGPPCSNQRYDETKCGPGGKYWAERKVW